MSDEPLTHGIRKVLSEPDSSPKRPRKPGGPKFHKPGCQCVIHKKWTAREWEEKAQPEPDRSETRQTEVIDADAPLVTTGRTAKDRVAEWVAIRSMEPGIRNKEIARRLGIGEHHLNTLISRATREGWLKIESPLDRIEYEIIPKTVDNLNHFLDKKDKTVTIEVAKGTIFKQFQEAQGISERPTTVLALKIESPNYGSEPEVKIVTGTILGRPKGYSDITDPD